mgnify:CR=1 FL=1
MNNIPQIIVNSGFEVDQNGTLEGVVLPTVVTTLAAPSKIVFGGQTLTYIPTTKTALLEFEAPNMVSLTDTTGSLFYQYTNLTTLKFNSLQTLSKTASGSGTFANCGHLTTLSMPKLTTISMQDGTWNGFFTSCTALVNVDLPMLNTAYGYNNGHYLSVFAGCTGLQNVSLGSPGHPVSKLSNQTFSSCTQSGLTITVYTADGNAISGSPWGATNATIVWEEA